MNPIQTSVGIRTHRVVECRASTDYRLWLRFEDGREGSVFLGNLLEIDAFRNWRDMAQFCGGIVDPDAATVVWEGGIRLDADLLYQDLVASATGKEFDLPRLASVVE